MEYNEKECRREKDIALAECNDALDLIADRLCEMAGCDATWPRNGTLLAVRYRLQEVADLLPLTEAETINEAARRG